MPRLQWLGLLLLLPSLSGCNFGQEASPPVQTLDYLKKVDDGLLWAALEDAPQGVVGNLELIVVSRLGDVAKQSWKISGRHLGEEVVQAAFERQGSVVTGSLRLDGRVLKLEAPLFVDSISHVNLLSSTLAEYNAATAAIYHKGEARRTKIASEHQAAEERSARIESEANDLRELAAFEKFGSMLGSDADSQARVLVLLRSRPDLAGPFRDRNKQAHLTDFCDQAVVSEDRRASKQGLCAGWPAVREKVYAILKRLDG